MTSKFIACPIAATALLSGTTTAAVPAGMIQMPAAREQVVTSGNERRVERSGGTWIVAVLALLAVAGGMAAAALSGDSQPERP